MVEVDILGVATPRINPRSVEAAATGERRRQACYTQEMQLGDAGLTVRCQGTLE